MSSRAPELRDADRRLFRLVSEAAFANPFGLKRRSIDAELSDTAAGDPAWTERMLHKVGQRLAALAPHGKLDVTAYRIEDRDLVEHSVLFEAFHRHIDALDRLIEQQLAHPEGPLQVGFAADFKRALVERGIGAERARHALELFFQMRRAYYFISRGLVGQSPSMSALREQLWQALFTHDLRRYERQLWDRMEDFSTMLLGETGSGKGAAAAALGASGFIPFEPAKGRFAYSFADAFVPINLNEFPESLFESEIFGHRKGAFTGAIDHHEGVLARCKPHGTVFFDEIGEATLPVQVKLLRVLQDRNYAPVGSRELRRFSGRIVAATHRSLDALRERGALRDDFYYRLCSNLIEVPPLRRRLSEEPGELGELVSHLCARMTHPAGDSAGLAAEVSDVIRRELGPAPHFAGNVRELEQCVRRVLVTGHALSPARGGPLERADLANALGQAALSAEALLDQYCHALHARLGSYVEVARVSGLDRRTVKKHIERAANHDKRTRRR